MPILRTEIARTPLEQAQGLMGRKSLPKNSGMLFDFGRPGPRSFWMLNTYIPLQIAFVEENGRVGQIESMSPLSTKPVRSNENYRYALEVNDGWFNENDITVGSYIKLPADSLHKEAINFDPLKEWWRKINPWKKKDPVTENPATDAPVFENPEPEIVPINPSQPDPVQPQQAPDQPDQPGQQGQQGQQEQPNPKAVIEQSFLDILKTVMDTSGAKVIVEYITKDGYPIPKRAIVPPLELKTDARGNMNNLVTFWSDADGGYRSFLIDGPSGNGIQAIYDLQGNPIQNTDQVLALGQNAPLSQEDEWLAKGKMTPTKEELQQMEYQRLLTHKT